MLSATEESEFETQPDVLDDPWHGLRVWVLVAGSGPDLAACDFAPWLGRVNQVYVGRRRRLQPRRAACVPSSLCQFAAEAVCIFKGS